MASSNYPTMPMPPATGAQNLNFLSQPNIASEFTTSLKALIETIAPSDMGLTMAYNESEKALLPDKYAIGLMNYLRKKPYVLKELVGTQKVMYSDLSASDKTWVKNKIVELFKAERSATDYTSFSSRIVPESEYSWMDFRTVDCVFAAVIHELSPQGANRIDEMKLKGLTAGGKVEKIKTDEANEEALEQWLAAHLKIPRTVMQDTRLIYIMEQDLGFKNIAAIATFNDLKAVDYRGKTFIVSYEVTAGTTTQAAFWHTVHVSTKQGATPLITDRQAAALGRKPGISDTASCDVWEIKTDGEKFKALAKAFKDRS